MTEQELVARAKAGDQEAFARLVSANEKRVYNLTLRMTGNQSDAEDAAQEAFLNAWRGLKFFKGDSSFATWVYRLASNAAIDLLRRERSRRAGETLSLEDEETGGQLDLPDPEPGPVESLERRERSAALRRALDELSEEHRQVLEMRAIDDLSYEEIAQSLGLTVGTVKSRLARGRIALKKLLVRDGNFSGFLPSMETEGKQGGVQP